MKNIWKTNSIFKDKFICLGDWDFSINKTFPNCEYISADTETKLYLNGKLLTENEAHDLYELQGAKWCRMNIEVKAYAFMISDGNSFALFTNIEDFLTCCAKMLVKKVFWYNARFDFAIFDYYILTHHWKSVEEIIGKDRTIKKKFPANVYQSLNGDYGQRYQLRLWVSYRNSSSHLKVHNFKMIDICNIFPGGLRKNLEDWEIVDKSGKEVRKLHMDYVNATIEDDLDYMIADTKGLHLLAEKINKKVFEISGFSLFNGDYLTAGGLAKKSLLEFMFGKGRTNLNLKLFKNFFPMTAKEDKKFREHTLYQGGKCFVSPYKVGKIVKHIYKYDINSMYPTQMRNMKYPIGKGKKVKKIKDRENCVYVLKIKNIKGFLKENMVPVWYDTLIRDYQSRISEDESRYFWLEELEELKKYYVMIYDVEEILEYQAYYCKGAKDYVDNYYKIKSENKGAVKQGAKLFLNSAYGKIAQRIIRENCEYQLSEDGYVHLVKISEEIDEKNMMSVLVGSRITALSRTLLMKYIREICKGNPKKYFVYCDTDSVHALCEYKDTDDKELGKMKSEGIYEFGKYLAPKTYVLYNNLEENNYELEVHTKGVNTEVVKEILEEEMSKVKSENKFEIVASNFFKSGITYRCLTSLNCIGGKALIFIDKMLLNPKLEKESLGEDEMID